MGFMEGKTGLWPWAVVLLLAVVVISWPESSKKKNARLYQEARVDAFYAAQEAVKLQLVAPATAKFPDMDQCTVDVIDGGVWSVVCFVDAQNQIGVLSRSYFNIHLRRENNSWSTVSAKSW